MTDFIVKNRNGKREIWAVSETESQQVGTGKLLVLRTFEREDIDTDQAPLLFMRVGDLAESMYSRFRKEVWYLTENYSSSPLRITVHEYSEYTDLWHWLEKRINPLAVAIATILSTLLTLAGININSYLTAKKDETEISKVRKELNDLRTQLLNQPIQSSSPKQ